MMDLSDILILAGIGILVLFLFKPDIYNATAGKVVDAGVQATMDRVNANSSIENNSEEEHIPQDIGMPYIENITFFQCTSSNICERLFGGASYCNVIDGHCYK